MRMEQTGGRNKVKQNRKIFQNSLNAFLSKELKQSLAWETDKEAFSRAVRENFGQFSEERSKKLSMEQQRSPRLLVSEHGMNSKVRCDFISSLCCALYPRPPERPL